MAIENGIPQDGTGGGGSPIEANLTTHQTVGDGASTTFTMPDTFLGGSVSAYINGQKYPSSQVTENVPLKQVTVPTSGGSAPLASDNLEFIYLVDTP